jgi:hypothetical protein
MSSIFKNYLEDFKTFTNIYYLPHFSILYFPNLDKSETSNKQNILYLPNLDSKYTILGKWSRNWYKKEKILLGYIEQDEHQNIIFYIKSAFEFFDSNLISIPQDSFQEIWEKNYIHDPILNILFFNTKEFDKQNEKSLKEKIIYEDSSSETSTFSSDKSSNYSDIDISSEKSFIKLDKESSSDQQEYYVSKTDKPDVYWVYDDKYKYISSCLIPNIKTSKYMNSLFSSKQPQEYIKLKLKLHQKTNKYIPIV